jgi:hypothetical protein
MRVDTIGSATISGTPAALSINVPSTVIGFTRVDRVKAVEPIRCVVAFTTTITHPDLRDQCAAFGATGTTPVQERVET